MYMFPHSHIRYCSQQEQCDKASLIYYQVTAIIPSWMRQLSIILSPSCDSAAGEMGGESRVPLLQTPSINYQVFCLPLKSVHLLCLQPALCCLDVTAHLSSGRDCMVFTYAKTGALTLQGF